MACGRQLLCAYLRPSQIDEAEHAAAILKLLVTRLRQTWPRVKTVFRGDSGCCRQRILNYCERADMHYLVGLARNTCLEQMTEFVELAMKDALRVAPSSDASSASSSCSAKLGIRAQRDRRP